MSTESSSPAQRRWPWALAIVGVLLAAFLISDWLLLTPPQAERQPMQRQPRLVDARPIEADQQTVVVEAYGQVEASQHITLTARVSGVVNRISPDFVPGAQIQANAPLLWLDDADYRLALDDAKAALTAAESEWAQEQGSQAVAAEDFKLLGLEVSPSERALMLRQPQLQAAEAAVASARVAVQQAQLNLERTVIRAPFDARVLSRGVGVGSQVGGSGTPLGELVVASPYWVELLVAVDRLQWLDWSAASGSRVELVDASRPGLAPWSARLVQRLDAVEADGRRARLLVEVNPHASASGETLLLGTYIQARIHGATIDDAYALKPGWLQGRDLWVVRDDKLANVAVEIVHRGSDVVVARGPIQPGDHVVTSLLSGAVEGMQVRVQADDADGDQTAWVAPSLPGAL